MEKSSSNLLIKRNFIRITYSKLYKGLMVKKKPPIIRNDFFFFFKSNTKITIILSGDRRDGGQTIPPTSHTGFFSYNSLNILTQRQRRRAVDCTTYFPPSSERYCSDRRRSHGPPFSRSRIVLKHL